jgi:hypothetical protein
MNKILVWTLLIIGSWIVAIGLFKLISFMGSLVPMFVFLALAAAVAWYLLKPYTGKSKDSQDE